MTTTKKTQFINEDRSSKNRSKARRYLRDVGYSEDRVQELEKELIATFSPYIRDSDFKFILGVARFTHQGKIRTGDDISKVKDLIKHINMSHLEEYDNDFNGEEFETLHGRFETAIEQDHEKDQETLATRDFGGKSDYEVVKIDSYEKAKPYSEYTSWCVLGGEGTYNSYTSNGLGIFYFLLKDGYEDVPRERGDNAPKDEYGMSMIAVSVDEFGRLNSSTTRWNHECGGSDNMFTTEELSRLVGQNFYSVFKPKHTKEEIVQKIYKEGKKIKKKGVNFIFFNDKYYFLDDEGRVSLKKCFDNVSVFTVDGFARVQIKNKGGNFIDTKGEFLSPDLWFDDTWNFNNGFAKVQIKNKGWNFIDTKGEFLSPDLWFDNVDTFNDGFAGVQIKNKYNFINTKGEILNPDLWFDYVVSFNDNGFALVQIKNKGWNFINTKGKILSPDLWFDKEVSFNYGFARVKIENKYNFINTKGEILSPDLWFDIVMSFNNGFALVQIKNKGWNFINTKGKILSPDLWFDIVKSFNNGFARVKIKEGDDDIFINTKGELYHRDKKTKLTPEEVEALKQKQSQMTESSRIKQIINETINEFLLTENFQNDVNNLKRFGYELIDKEVINNYILFLVREPREGLYEIGITSNDREFTTPQSQEKIIPTERGGEFSTARGFQKTIRNWLNNYSPIYVGSLNKNKTFKYHRILGGLGFNVGRINHDDPVHLGGNQFFPESWNFIIS